MWRDKHWAWCQPGDERNHGPWPMFACLGTSTRTKGLNHTIPGFWLNLNSIRIRHLKLNLFYCSQFANSSLSKPNRAYSRSNAPHPGQPGHLRARSPRNLQPGEERVGHGQWEPGPVRLCRRQRRLPRHGIQLRHGLGPGQELGLVARPRGRERDANWVLGPQLRRRRTWASILLQRSTQVDWRSLQNNELIQQENRSSKLFFSFYCFRLSTSLIKRLISLISARIKKQKT